MAKLKKGLGLSHVFCIASGAMISSGLFVLPGLAYEKAGPAVVVAYMLAGLLAVPGLLSTAELATAMPRAGSDYFFITRGMGSAVGTVAGLFNWVAFSLKASFALVGMAAFVALFTPIDMRITGTALGVAFVVLNLVGVRHAARVQLALVAGLFALMAVFVFRGLGAMDVARFEPFSPHGGTAILATAGFVFVSYGGLLKIASVAEEIRHPSRTIPGGMILSLVIVTAVYMLMVGVTVGVLAGRDLSGSLTPIADAAFTFMGRGGQIALGVAASLAFLTTANAGIMTGSRYLLAMSRDGMLPRGVARVGRRFNTPHVALLLTGAMVVLPQYFELYVLVEAASIGLILTNILANLSVIMLRESGLQNYRPTFRAPLYPWIQIAGIFGFLLLLFEMGVEAYVIGAVLAVSGFCLYWFYGRARVQRDSALLHLVQRITARELVDGTLEAELKDIIRQRDEIELDRFDRILEKCAVADFDEKMSAEDLFDHAAARLAERLGADKESLYNALVSREKDSSTVISPGLAVPHVILEGERAFDILLARSRKGFDFGPDKEPVHSVFVLVGTSDERNFHLQALSSIAQVVQEPNFKKRWMEARDEQGLRDVVLLAERMRH